jgi:histidine phosphotransferase ChpT
METFDLDLAEMLSARLCHELVSPVGAIANGVEILEEEPDFAEEARRLIAQSTAQASRRLQYYRLAYAAHGAIPEDLARVAALALFADGKVRCRWPEGPGIGPERQKFLLNLLLVAADCLPRGGVLMIKSGLGLNVLAQGDGARLPKDAEPLVATMPLDGMTPRTVQAIFTRRLAARLGLRVEAVHQPPDTVSLLAVC